TLARAIHVPAFQAEGIEGVLGEMDPSFIGAIYPSLTASGWRSLHAISAPNKTTRSFVKPIPKL
ncbi:MAG: hypothetical protein KDC71_19175, partial [Acidobacteria bacterium]|nr:hypothetical protein [Acidobacteriota bacterium]